MPLTDLQRSICRLLAEHRIRSGESYVAGGVALNELLGASRFSRDSRDWRAALAEAREVVDLLPADTAGSCVLLDDTRLCRLSASDLEPALTRGTLAFRAGSIRGALPEVRAIRPRG